MFGKISAELNFLRRICRENGLSAYLGYRMRRLRGDTTPLSLTTDGQRYRMRATGPDLQVAWTARTEFSVLERLYPRDQTGVIIDAGGFIGSASLELARLYPKARILTIEPSSENFSLLKENIAGHPQIEPIHAALAQDGAPATLSLQDRATGPWGYSIATHGAPDLEQVPVLTMSALMDLVGGEDLLIFKMDIEGAETALMQSNTDWLSRTNVLMIELHERITPGCEDTFFEANANRCIVQAGGEKFVSIGREYFAKHAHADAA